MKRIIEIALLFILGAGAAEAGSIGGASGGGSVVTFDHVLRLIYIPGRLDERFEIVRRGSRPDSDLTSYFMEAADFSRLQQNLDSRQVINANGEYGGTRSYRAVSGDQPQQVELIDRRAAIRSEVR